MGRNPAARYSSDREEWYRFGCKDKGRKMSAAQMREALFQKYPNRHDIPIERHVSACIAKLGASSAQKVGFGETEDGGGRASRRRGMSTDHQKLLRAIVEEDIGMGPREGRTRLLQRLGLSEE